MLYRLEVYNKEGQLIKVLLFIEGEDIERGQYKEKFQAEGFTVRIFKEVFDGETIEIK